MVLADRDLCRRAWWGDWVSPDDAESEAARVFVIVVQAGAAALGARLPERLVVAALEDAETDRPFLGALGDAQTLVDLVLWGELGASDWVEELDR